MLWLSSLESVCVVLDGMDSHLNIGLRERSFSSPLSRLGCGGLFAYGRLTVDGSVLFTGWLQSSRFGVSAPSPPISWLLPASYVVVS